MFLFLLFIRLKYTILSINSCSCSPNKLAISCINRQTYFQQQHVRQANNQNEINITLCDYYADKSCSVIASLYYNCKGRTKNSTSLTYDLQNLEGGIIGFHFLIWSLKLYGTFFVSVGKVPQSFGPK